MCQCVQVLSLALSALSFSALADPFTIYFELQPWRLGPVFCVAYMLLDSALPFVSFLALIMLNLDRLLFATSPTHYHGLLKRLVVRLLVLAVPWAVGLGVLLPLWLLAATSWPMDGVCMYGITKRAAVASSVLSLFLPCVALVVLTVLILVTLIGDMPQDTDELILLRGPRPDAPGPALSTHPKHVNANHAHLLTSGSRRLPGSPMTHAPTIVHAGSVDSNSERSGPARHRMDTGSAAGLDASRPSPLQKQNHRGVAVALCVLNLLTVITQLPYGAISILEPECVEPTCSSTIKLIQAMGWMRSVTFSLLPLGFVLFTHVRHALCDPCENLEEDGGGRRSTFSGATKSEHVELTSVNLSGSQSNLAHSTTSPTILQPPHATVTFALDGEATNHSRASHHSVSVTERTADLDIEVQTVQDDDGPSPVRV
jgi:hypothetical protein